jgi:RNA polymerase sigma factor (sigma-70 family)
VTFSNQPQSDASRFRAELNAQFRLPLIAYFLKRVGNRSEAEDLTQEVFVRVLAQSNTVDPARAKSYVFTAAANLLRDRQRQAAARRTTSHADIDDPSQLANYQLVEDIDPERVLVGRQTLREVLAALDGLSQRTRDIFVLYRIEKMKQHEIATLYGLSDSSIEKHLAKAIAYLSQRFTHP